MTEIVDDRGDISVTYKSWKAYAKALKREVRCLQQFLSTERVTACFKASVKEKVKGLSKRKRGWYAKAKKEFWGHCYEEPDRERVMERCS